MSFERDLALDDRGVGDGALLELVLRDRPCTSKSPFFASVERGRSLGDEGRRAKHGDVRVRALDAVAVVAEVDEQQDRCQDERCDPGDDRTPGRPQHSSWQQIFHGSSPYVVTVWFSTCRSMARIWARRRRRARVPEWTPVPASPVQSFSSRIVDDAVIVTGPNAEVTQKAVAVGERHLDRLAGAVILRCRCGTR